MIHDVIHYLSWLIPYRPPALHPFHVWHPRWVKP